MATVRLTMSQALTRWMTAQSIEQLDGSIEPAFAGVWAIFGHGNVAGLGEALYGVRDQLPTYRGHNEQSMAHIAIAYAKQKHRRRMQGHRRRPGDSKHRPHSVRDHYQLHKGAARRRASSPAGSAAFA